MQQLYNQRLERVDLVRSGEYEVYCDQIKLDSDYIFDPTDLEEVDYR